MTRSTEEITQHGTTSLSIDRRDIGYACYVSYVGHISLVAFVTFLHSRRPVHNYI